MKKIIFSDESAGFTIMELLIIVALIAILATTAIIIFNPLLQIQKGWDARRKVELSQLQKVLEDWYNDKGCYPQPLEICYHAADANNSCPICGHHPNSPSFSPYLSSLPCDPQSPSKTYLYQYDGTSCSSWYRIYTNLSNEADKAVGEGGCLNGCGPGGSYNFLVSSPNAPTETSGKYYCSQGVDVEGYGNCTEFDNTVWKCTPSYLTGTCDNNGCQIKSNCVHY